MHTSSWLLLLVVRAALAYKESFTCARYPSLVAGLSMSGMGGPTFNGNSRTVTVRRGGVLISSGSTYNAGETLSVSVSSTAGDIILEASGGAQFSGGSCAGAKRYYGSTRNIVMPTSGNSVEIWAGFATSRVPVQITARFLLTAAMETRTPTSAPSRAPTAIPSRFPSMRPSVSPTQLPTTPTLQPTRQPTCPTRLPSTVPSSEPTSTFSPTQPPTCSPSSMPSAAPTRIPTATPSLIPTFIPSTIQPTTIAPTVSNDQTYSVSVDSTLVGVGVQDVKSTRKDIGEIVCLHLNISLSRCAVVSEGAISTVVATSALGATITILVHSFQSELNAQIALGKITVLLTDRGPNGFMMQFNSITSYAVTDVVSGSYVMTAALGVGSYQYSCSLSSSLKLHWSVAVDASYVLGMLEMDSATSWASGGIVANSAKQMVESMPNRVFLLTPDTYSGRIVSINSYDSLGIQSGSSLSASSIISKVAVEGISSFLHFTRKVTTTDTTDPALELENGGKNKFIWAHGKSPWPSGHSAVNRGFVEVFWIDGKCLDVELAQNYYVLLVVIGTVVLLLLSAIAVRLKFQGFFGKPIGFIICNKVLPNSLLGLSLGEIIMITAFYGILVVEIMLHAEFSQSEMGYETNRAYGLSVGTAALFMLAIASLPVSKTSIWSSFIGLPYDRATIYHRLAAISAIVLLTIHYVLSIDTWGSEVSTFDVSLSIGEVNPAYGLLAAICFWTIMLSAVDPVRKLAYEVFKCFHLLFSVGAIFVCLHVTIAIYFMIIPVTAYILDWILSFMLFRSTKSISFAAIQDKYVILKVIVNGSCTNPSPGSFYWIHIPAVSIFELHPFSVYSFNSETNELSFAISVASMNSWTQRLLQLAQDHRADSLPIVHIRGPFGKLRYDPLMEQYDNVTLLAGGIGITAMLPVLDSIVKCYSKMESIQQECPLFAGSNRVFVTLVWFSRDKNLFSLFKDVLDLYYCHRDVGSPKQRLVVNIRLFCTSSGQEAPQVSSRCANKIGKVLPVQKEISDPNPLWLVCDQCKPSIQTVLKESIQSNSKDGKKVYVLTCGPAGLMSATRVASSELLRADKSVSKVDFHSETFGF